MRTILAIDPGNEKSATVLLKDGLPTYPQHGENAHLLNSLRGNEWNHGAPTPLLAIEMVASYGMAVGKEVFETVRWIGRFQEAWEHRGGEVRLVYRRDVKLFLCHTVRANDSNIRAALIDQFGPGKEKAIGNKKAPGPLYELKGDTWSALAIAITAAGQGGLDPAFEETLRLGSLARAAGFFP